MAPCSVSKRVETRLFRVLSLRECGLAVHGVGNNCRVLSRGTVGCRRVTVNTMLEITRRLKAGRESSLRH